MKSTIRLSLLATLILVAAVSTRAEEKARKDAGAQFTAEAFLNHVKYLASDELEGRLPGSAGSAAAAEYIMEHFRAAGLQPGGEDGEWLQHFEVRRGKRLMDEKALLEVNGLDRQWKVREDWIPFPFGEMEDVEGQLAFVGYGIQAVQYDYDDYGDFDAKGKILLILRFEPQDEDPDAEFGGQQPSRYALFVRKARTAHKHGAKALLIVNPPNRNPDEDELYRFGEFNSQQTYQLPMAHISRELASAILARANMPDLKILQEKLDKERKSLAKDMDITLKLHPGVEANTMPAANVIGWLPGTGNTSETIVVGAHRDHLGKVPRQFQRKDQTPMIHNGADDNATGTAALLELARTLAAEDARRRNVLFIAFDGEEMGLLGSRHFVEHPTIPLEDVQAMINFDMIGRLQQDKYTVFGTTTSPDFPALVEEAATQVELEYKAPRATGGSDHAPFIRREIPAMFPFTGIHKQYHQPEDDWDLIDAEGATKVLSMWHHIIHALANMETGPAWSEPTSDDQDSAVQGPRPAVEENKEYDDQVNKQADKAESDEPPSRSSIRVRLGIVPDMADDDKPGMLVETVLDGGSAKLGGILEGDRILKINDEDIRDIYAYMRAVQNYKPGETADVLVERKGEKLTLKITWQAARPRENDG
ncbi:MAG: M20/M25/M40 family metallo-hydrolase [Planctomycetota bacterium]